MHVLPMLRLEARKREHFLKNHFCTRSRRVLLVNKSLRRSSGIHLTQESQVRLTVIKFFKGMASRSPRHEARNHGWNLIYPQ